MQSVISTQTHKWAIFDKKLKRWLHNKRAIKKSDIFMLMEPDWKIMHMFCAESVYLCDDAVSDSNVSTIQYRPLNNALHELPDEVREMVNENYDKIFK